MPYTDVGPLSNYLARDLCFDAFLLEDASQLVCYFFLPLAAHLLHILYAEALSAGMSQQWQNFSTNSSESPLGIAIGLKKTTGMAGALLCLKHGPPSSQERGLYYHSGFLLSMSRLE